MTFKWTFALTATGHQFSPRSVEQRLGKLFSNKSEPGDVESNGEFTGKALPDGHGCLTIEHSAPWTSRNLLSDSEMVELADFVVASRACGASDLALSIHLEFPDQCNIALESDSLTALGALGVPIGFCFHQTAASPEPS